jgi:single-strand DNA-binding protein
MPDINNVVIAGNLTRDPSFRKTTNGTPVANFWIASNRKFRDNTGQWRENVCYVGVVAWYKLAESCNENLQKGSAVLVEGELQSRSLRTEEGRNRNIVEVKARRIQFLNKRDDAFEDEHSDDASRSEHLSEHLEDEEADERIGVSSPSSQNANDETAGNISDKDSWGSQEANPDKGKFDFGYQDLDI